ncbi:hypothetical protein ABLO27_23875 [Roseibium sp. SCPC15]|uniref:hypothetical protein n=1 Tax=Roseibium sp. SCP15 TaxID=3141376 RepID=UPI00333D49F2
MSEAVGSGTSQVFQPSLSISRTEKVAEQAEAIRARQSEAVAETVQRQAKFSANRAENLVRQAETLENRAESGNSQNGIGDQVDISV